MMVSLPSWMDTKKSGKGIAVTSACVTSAILLYRYWRQSEVTTKVTKPFKRVTELPFFGILFQIEGGPKIARVLEEWADKIGDEGAFEVTIFGKRRLVICKWEEAKKMVEPRPTKVRRLKDFEGFKDMADGVFMAEGANWRRQRQLLAPAFHPRVMPDYVSSIYSIVGQVGDRASAAVDGCGKLNITTLMGEASASILVKILTGNDIFASDFLPAMVAQVKGAFEVALDRVVCPVPYWELPLLPSILPSNRTFRRMHALLEDMMSRIDTQGKTLYAKMMEAQDGDKLSREELIGNLSTLFLAGTDTTNHTVAWASYELSRQPDLQASIADEAKRVAPSGVSTTMQVEQLKLTKAVMNETLRMHTPVPILGHTTLADVEIAGRTVPAGSDNIVLVRSCTNSSDEVKKNLGNDLHLWKPERWLDSNGEVRKFQPLDAFFFGYGARTCLGKSLAELEAVLLISEVCRRVHLKPCEYEVQEVTDLTSHPDRDIVLDVSKRD